MSVVRPVAVVNVGLVPNTVPPVGELYHVNTGLVIDPAVSSEAVIVAFSPIHVVTSPTQAPTITFTVSRKPSQ